MANYKYHPEITGLKTNEDGTEVLLNEVPVDIKIRKSGNHPFRFFYYKGNQIGLARLILECWKDMPPIPKMTAKHIDGDYSNYHYTNLEWGNRGGNAKYPPKLTPTAEAEILEKSKAGLSDSEIAREYDVTRNAIYNFKKRINNRQNKK